MKLGNLGYHNAGLRGEHVVTLRRRVADEVECHPSKFSSAEGQQAQFGTLVQEMAA
jgi:hypothetical protein